MHRKRRAGWLAPTGLIALSAVPVLAGAVRMNEIVSGAPITPANARFLTFPAPVAVHIVAVTLYTVLGAFQFVPGLRARRPRRHRAAGRLLVVAGLLAALSGLWMTLFSEVPPADEGLLAWFRLVFGSGMLAALVLGFRAIRRRDVRRHRAWMARAYAIGLGAGTQALTQGLWLGFAGPPDDVTRALLLGASWVINLAVAEWIIRRRRGSRRLPSPVSP